VAGVSGGLYGAAARGARGGGVAQAQGFRGVHGATRLAQGERVPVVVELGNVLLGVAAGGHLEVLQWVREQGCHWNWETCAIAALYGHLEVLKWAREHHCPWNRLTCAHAAGAGHLQVLRWALEHGCPRDEEMLELAAHNGQLEAIKLAREHGCPWSGGAG